MSTLPRSIVLSALALLGAGHAAATCLPIVHHVNVGAATGTGTGCNYVYADLQTAINNVTCPNTVLSIAGGVTLANVALEINGKTGLTIVGLGAGTTCNDPPPACDPTVGCGGGGGAPPAPAVTLQGTGAGSVFYIHGTSNVTLESLTLKNGGGTDFGGGIHFTGAGSLTILNSTITQNSANSQGGGIQFNGSGGNATLTLGAGTIIDLNNSGGNGGGIHVNGTARLFALQPYTEILDNTASGEGGGLYVIGPARADIGSAGFNGGPVIFANSAAYGGGIAVVTADTSLAEVRAFSVDPNNPVQISGNSASHTGGGVYVKPYISGTDSGEANFCAFDYRIDGNTAQEGTAIYSDLDTTSGAATGGGIELNGSYACGPEPPPNLGSVPCTPGVACNTMNGNVAENTSFSPTPGSVILLQDGSTLTANRVIMRNNHGAHAIRTLDSATAIQNCLIADNTLTAEMIRAENDGGDDTAFYRTALDGCTIVNNSNQGAPVIYSARPLALTNSIVDEEGLVTLNYAAGAADLAVNYVLSNDTSTLQGGTGVIQGAPSYVNAAASDYHLRASSIGIDYAPATGGFDLDRLPRDVDLAEVPNNYGTRDIGAYELQYVCSPDTIYCNSFEQYQ